MKVNISITQRMVIEAVSEDMSPHEIMRKLETIGIHMSAVEIESISPCACNASEEEIS